MKSLTTSECPQSGPVNTVIIKESDRDRFALSGNWGGTASNRPRRQRNLTPGIFYFPGNSEEFSAKQKMIERKRNYDKKNEGFLDFTG